MTHDAEPGPLQRRGLNVERPTPTSLGRIAELRLGSYLDPELASCEVISERRVGARIKGLSQREVGRLTGGGARLSTRHTSPTRTSPSRTASRTAASPPRKAGAVG